MKKEDFFIADSITAGYGKKEVIQRISFSQQPHTLTCLMGNNGCGKTTLLRCLANQLSHEGKCYLQGEKVEEKNVRQLAQKISYIPQKSGIGISMPVLDVVLMGFNSHLKLLQNPSEKHKKLAREALEKVGLEREAEIDFLTLSEGQKQLVILARMMVEETELLLLDEPDSALDIQNRYVMMNYIKSMIEEKPKAGILCLHDPVLALEFCEQLIMIEDGKCFDILYPKMDSMEKMEKAFQKIYGSISLAECIDKRGKRHLHLIWEKNR